MTEGNGKAVKVDGRKIELRRLDKVFFPESGITKGGVVDYYRRIAKVALPHYRGRPLTMHRFPDGIGGEGFFQKDVPGYFPDWVERVSLRKKDGRVDYIVADSAATLVYIANQGCITPHLALARADKPDHPDRMVFDLDPPGDDFTAVQRAARRVKALLDALELPSFIQTTGSKGAHVVVPLDRTQGFDPVRAFARSAAEALAKRHPGELTVEQRKAKRKRRVFLDYMRNAYGQTAVAPYAVRAREGAPVATPLGWKEAGRGGLTAQSYNLSNIFRRLSQTGDPWAGIGRRAVSLKRARKRLSGLD